MAGTADRSFAAKERLMAGPQLSVRSARARDLAHHLAQREQRTVAEIVERALEAYALRNSDTEPAADFYKRLAAESATDLDLDVMINAVRARHEGVDL
jgi:hypothetical protein